ncbi:MAG: NAD(P)H-flavin reductase/ferredoxin [Gammaproteobacteria bacterium]
MSIVSYKNGHYQTEVGESVLDALLRHDINVPYACKAGVCQVCVMQCQQGTISSAATLGLKDSQVRDGNFIACQCIPTENIIVQDADALGLFSQVKVIEKENLATDICRIRMRTATDLYYRAGQFINLRMDNTEIRSYSLASLPTRDDFLELHVKRMRKGVVSNWLFSEVKTGDILDIQGPFGDCFYMPKNVEADILMIGTGTGLAPLIGILREAIETGHKGQISLYHGEKDAKQLYLDEELRSLAARHNNIQYFPCASSIYAPEAEGLYRGRASDLAFLSNPDLTGSLLYLCGSPSMVDESRQQAQLNGAKLGDIYADPFVTKDLRLTVRQ